MEKLYNHFLFALGSSICLYFGVICISVKGTHPSPPVTKLVIELALCVQLKINNIQTNILFYWSSLLWSQSFGSRPIVCHFMREDLDKGLRVPRKEILLIP